MTSKIWTRRVIPLLLSTVVGLGVAELLVRWLELVPPFYPQASTAIFLYHEDPNGPILLTPGWQGWVSGAWTTINERGFRDRVFPAEKTPGTVRVAVIGDSYTMGDGVALEFAWPRLLERQLVEAGVACEVMNCAVSATNSLNQLATLGEVLRDYRPDLVILGYNLNDFDNPQETRFERRRADGHALTVHPDGKVTRDDPGLSWHQRVRFSLFTRSYLYRFLKNLRHRSSGVQESLAEAVDRWIEAGDHLRSFSAVEAMQRSCDEAGIGFLVAILPDTLRIPPDVDDFSGYPFADEHRMIVGHLESSGIECLELTTRLAGHDPRELVLRRQDRHFNPQGNALVAGEIADVLAEKLDAYRRR